MRPSSIPNTYKKKKKKESERKQNKATTNAGKDKGKKEPLYTAGGKVN
jgi:hypothetical protein